MTAARYYVHNWLPPRVGDPATLQSYSAYGYSYLNEFDVVYLVAAKFTSVLALLFAVNDVMLYRLFNLLLFLPVIGILFSKDHKAWIAFPLLLTPQAWYVYSYFNADAFAMTVALLFAWRVAEVTESVDIISQDRAAPLRFVVPIALLIGLMLLSKLNYVPLIYLYVSMLLLCARSIDWRIILTAGIAAIASVWIFFTAAGASSPPARPDPTVIAASVLLVFALVVAAILAWKAYRRGDASRRFITLTLASILVGVGLAATRPAIDAEVNGSWIARQQNVIALSEQLAFDQFKPSTTSKPDWQSPSLYLRKQGISLSEMIFTRSWAAISASSMFGLYGYMSIVAPYRFYTILMTSFAVIFLIAAVHLFREKKLVPVAIASTVAAVMILLDSMLTSWTRDFQPQGRYLLPLSCVLGLMLFTLARRAESPKLRLSFGLITGASLLSFAFGAASFLMVALRMIEK